MPVPGLASIAGGKFTTYRLMARDVVDAAVADFGRPVPGSVTDQVPLLGADGLAAVQPAAGRLAEDYGVSRATVDHLLGRYGTLATEVLDLIKADSGLGRPLAAGIPTCAPRSPTPSPVRTPCTWRTCWCGGRGCSSSRRTRVFRRPPT